jgi:beta-glucosidase
MLFSRFGAHALFYSHRFAKERKAAVQALHFPKGFIWGTSTSGHQIEGWNDSSDWWEWEQRGHIYDGTRSGRAMEYWDRYESDHELMAQLGYPAFRLGVEWARIEPEPGRIDARAVNHYRKILTSLRAHGILICLTLNHWVLPHWVVQQHDWLNPKTIEDFLAYARIVVEALGEFPDYWVTFNEPMVPAIAGNLLTRHPPQRGSWRAFRTVTNAQLEAHAHVYRLIHQRVPGAPDGGATRVGVAKAYPWIEPWGSRGMAGLYERVATKAARLAAYEAWDQSVLTGRRHVLLGHGVVPGLRGSYDFCGINYYSRMSMKRVRSAHSQYGIDPHQIPPGVDRTQMGWQIYPRGMAMTVRHVWKRFGKPILITENGIADDQDAQRPGYTLRHLAAIHRAIAEGIPVMGYFHWSFIDNFEWREGFSKRFGLIAVDHTDPELKRIPRPSAHMYSEIVRQNAVTEAIVEKYAPSAREQVFAEANT